MTAAKQKMNTLGLQRDEETTQLQENHPQSIKSVI